MSERTELWCKDCRYWYGADPDESRFARPAASRPFVLSAPYQATRGGPW